MNSFGVVDSPLKRNVIRKQSRKKITKPHTTHRQDHKSSLRLSGRKPVTPRQMESIYEIFYTRLRNCLYAILGNGRGGEQRSPQNRPIRFPHYQCQDAILLAVSFFFFSHHTLPPLPPHRMLTGLIIIRPTEMATDWTFFQ